MTLALNIDLFLVGVAAAATAILGFVIFLNDTKSQTGRAFLFISLITVFWDAANFLNHQVASVTVSFWLIRLTVFFAVWHAFSLFHLFYVFPRRDVSFPRWYMFALPLIPLATSLLTLTPLVFTAVQEISPEGQITKISNGPGIILFTIVVIGFIGSGVALLIRKLKKSEGRARRQFRTILAGIVATFSLLLLFNFIFPVFLANPRFLPLGAVFFIPYIFATFYAITRHNLFNIKVISTEILVLALAIATLLEVLLSTDLPTLILRTSTFLLVLAFGIVLIRNIIREIKQRETLELLTEKLAAANEELKKLDVAKSEFISIASHQLRAPLTVIKGYVSMILENSFGVITEKAQRTLEIVAGSANQLIGLVGSLLNLSRIEAGKINYALKENNFENLVTSVIEEFKQNAIKRRITLAFQNPTRPIPPLIFDAEKIREVIINLIDNAIKYSPEGSSVVITEEIKTKTIGKNTVRFSVKDQGIGIKPEDVSRLFTKFTRTIEAQKTDPNGMGIGLYFVKRVVEDHGGAVGATSEGAGKGSTFFVELPIRHQN